MIRAAPNRESAGTAQVNLGADLSNLLGRDHDRFGTHGRIHERARAFLTHAGFGVRHPQQTSVGVHDPASGVVFQRLIEIDRMLVEPDGFGDAIVRADDGGVATRVSRANVVCLQHRNVSDAVLRGQVVGRAEAVSSSADDDHVIGRFGRVPGEVEQGFDELIHGCAPRGRGHRPSS